MVNKTDANENNEWYTDKVKITLTAIDNTSGVHSTYYKLGRDRWIEYTNPITITNDGEHTFKYYSVDKAGNKGDEKSSIIRIDKTNPTISFNKPTYGHLYLFGMELLPLKRTVIIGKAMIETTVLDETSGIERVEFYVDDELKQTISNGPYEWLWDERILFNHIIKAVTYDNAGNMVHYFKLFTPNWSELHIVTLFYIM